MENNYKEKNIKVHPTAIIYPNVVLHENVVVGPFCILGEPTMQYYRSDEYEFKKTEIGANTILRSNTVIYEGVEIGENFQTGHHVTIRENTKFGKNCSVGTLSDIQNDVKIGNFVRIHSNVFLAPETKIDDYVWLFPHTVLTDDMYPPMNTMQSCKVGKYAIIGAGSILLPDVEIGENALVAAGSVVSKNVNNNKMVMGVPAREKGNVEDIRDENRNQLYPWKEYLKEFRGYPWQVEEEQKN